MSSIEYADLEEFSMKPWGLASLALISILLLSALVALSLPIKAKENNLFGDVPLAHIWEPQNGSFVKRLLKIRFLYGDSDLKRAELRFGDTLLFEKENASTVENLTLYVDTELYSDGNYTITLTVTDYEGYTNTSVVYITVDNTEPSKVAITSPGNNTAWGRGSNGEEMLNVTLVAEDNLCLKQVELLLDDAPIATWNFTPWQNTSATLSHVVNTATIPDGKHAIRAIAYDYAGNSRASEAIVVTTSNPPYVVINSPENYTSGNFLSINATFEDSLGIEYRRVALKNSTWSMEVYSNSTLTYEEEYCATLNLTSLAEGVYTLEFFARNTIGNTDEKSIVVIVDRTPPLSVEVLSPANASWARGTVNITVRVVDNLAVKMVELYVDSLGTPIDTVVLQPPYDAVVTVSLNLPTGTLSDGVHYLYFRAVDASGASFVTNFTFLLTFDNTPPSGEFLWPTADVPYLSGVTMLVFSYSDNFGVDSAFIEINGSTYEVTGETTFCLDTTQYPDGPLTITLTLYDYAGNKFETSAEVLIDNTAPIFVGATFYSTGTVIVTVFDNVSGVARVLMNYSINRGEWNLTELELMQGNYYYGYVGELGPGDTIDYYLILIDQAGNKAVTSTYRYVMPAVPLFPIPQLAVAALLPAIVIARRKWKK